MKLIISITFLSISLISFSQTTQLEWFGTYGDDFTLEEENANSMIIDSDGNIFNLGHFKYTMDFDPGPEDFLITPVPVNGRLNLFLQKLDPEGNLLWVKQWGAQPSTGTLFASLILDNEDNVIITSNFKDIWDLDPGPDEFLIGNLNNSQHDQFFIIKVDNDGNFIWGNEISGDPAGNNHVRAIDKSDGLEVDSQNNIHIGGKFQGTIDFDPKITVHEVTSHQFPDGSYQSNSFILSLDSQGNFLAANTLISEVNNFMTSIRIDNQGNFLYVGKFFGSGSLDVDFGPGEYLLPPPYIEEEFILKYDNNNNLGWVKVIGNNLVNCYENIRYVITDSNGNILLGGYFIGESFDADPGPDEHILTNVGAADCFLIKLDQNGEFLWAYSFGSEGTERIETIAVDENNYIYNQGYFRNTIDFDPTGNEDFIIPTTTEGNNSFIQKISPEGQYLGTTTIDPYGSSGVNIRNIWTDNNNDLVLFGIFRGTADFDPGPDVLLISSQNESLDLFVLKLSQLPLNIDDKSLIPFATLYPNPTNGRAEIELTESYDNITIQVTDITGKIIHTNNPKPSKIIPLEIQAASGLYFVTIIADTKKTVLKLIKE